VNIRIRPFLFILYNFKENTNSFEIYIEINEKLKKNSFYFIPLSPIYIDNKKFFQLYFLPHSYFSDFIILNLIIGHLNNNYNDLFSKLDKIICQ